MDKLKLAIEPLTCAEQGMLRSAGGEPLKVCGKKMISLEVEGLSMPHEFVVVQNLTCDILLDYEILYRYNVLRVLWMGWLWRS